MDIQRRIARIVAAGGLASCLAACGGGGGSAPASNPGTGPAGGTVTLGGDGPSARYSVQSVAATGATNAMQQVAFDVTISNALPGTTGAAIQVGTGFLAVDTTVTAKGNGVYHVVLVVDSTLAPGTYTGNLGVVMCSDPACQAPNPPSGSLLPYAVTVLPDPLAGVTVDGAAPVVDSAGMPLVHVGDTATLTTNIATTWLTPEASDGYTILSSTSTSATVQFTANSTSTTPIVRYVTAGGSSQYWFQFSN